jgi:hypothetical protein
MTKKLLAFLMLGACSSGVDLSLGIGDPTGNSPGDPSGLASIEELAWSASEFGPATYNHVGPIDWSPDGDLVAAVHADDRARSTRSSSARSSSVTMPPGTRCGRSCSTWTISTRG